MSTRVDTASLIAGATVVGNRGLGILGSTILLTTGGGTDGDGVLFNDVELGDEAKEFRAYITTPPSAGTLVMDEDGTFTFTGAAMDSFTYEGFADGVSYGTALVTVYDTAGTNTVTPVNSVMADRATSAVVTQTNNVAPVNTVMGETATSPLADAGAPPAVVHTASPVSSVMGETATSPLAVPYVPGATVWPAGRSGPSHVAVVPWVSARYAVEPADVVVTPLRVYEIAPGGTEVLAVDFASMYLRSAADEAGSLLAVDSDDGLSATPSPALAAAVPGGVVSLTVPAPAAAGAYLLRTTLGTVGGRIKPAVLQVQALQKVAIIKVFPLDQGATEVFEIDFDALYLPGHSDTATQLVTFAASAGITVQSEVPAGAALSAGVVRFQAVAPTVAGDYHVTASVRTAAGRVKPVRVVLRVNPAD